MANYPSNHPSHVAGSSAGSYDPYREIPNFERGSREPDILIRLPEATRTLLGHGIPDDYTHGELAYIFQRWEGYEDLRLVRRPSQLHRDAQVSMCFVDFASPAHAAAAMDGLQGFKFDVHDDRSPVLRLQFCRHPLARPRAGHHASR